MEALSFITRRARNCLGLGNPPGTEEFYNTWQFSQGVRVGDMVWLAGQLGIGPDGKPGATIEEQTRFAFQNVARLLEITGGTLADIVDLTTYHVDINDLPKVAGRSRPSSSK